MFDSSKQILYFSPQTIQPATVSGSASARSVTLGEEIPWSKATLSETLIGLKKKFGETFSVIVDDDLAFTFGMMIPSEVKEEKNFVRIKAAETVPEEIDDVGWDFKEVLQGLDKKNKIVQFASLENGFYRSLSQAVRDSGAKIEMTEPVTCSLARLLVKNLEPTLVIHQAKKYLVFLAFRGLVFAVESFDTEPTPDAVIKFTTFVKESFGFSPKTVFLSGEFGMLNSATPAFAAWTVEMGRLDPFSGMAMKEDMGDKNGASLNIVVDSGRSLTDEKPQDNVMGISETDKEPAITRYEPIGLTGGGVGDKRRERMFDFSILGLALIVIIVNGVILYQSNEVANVISGAAVLKPISGRPNVIPIVTTSSVNMASSTVSASSTNSTSSATSTKH